MKITDFKLSIFETIWDSQLHKKHILKQTVIHLMRLITAVARDVREGSLSLRATGLVYTTLLALAPMLAICFSVLKGFGIHNQLEPFLLNMLAPLGEQGRDITTRMISFVDNIQVGVLGVVGFAFLIYSVISMMQEIEAALNDIWRIRGTRRFGQRVRDYLGVLFIAPLFMFLSIAMTTAIGHAPIIEKWFGIRFAGNAFHIFADVIPYLLFVLAFTALYIFMPNTKVKLFPAFIAGMVTTILWKILGAVFGTFMIDSANYAAVYSAFAALALFMIWMYTGWLIVLIGASVSYYIQNPSNQKLSRTIKSLGIRVKEKLALTICYEVSKAFYTGQTSVTAVFLARHIGLPMMAVEDIIEDLVKGGILSETEQGYIPACPFDETSVYDMLQVLRAANEEGSIKFAQVKSCRQIDHALKLYHDTALRSLGSITLKELSSKEMPSKEMPLKEEAERLKS